MDNDTKYELADRLTEAMIELLTNGKTYEDNGDFTDEAVAVYDRIIAVMEDKK